MKRFYAFFMGLIFALSAVAAPQFSLREKVMKTPADIQRFEKKIAKAPAKANGQVINIEANNLAIDDSYNDMYLEFLGYGFVMISGGTDEWSVEGYLYPETADYYTTYSSAAEDIELAVNEVEVSVTTASLVQTADGPKFTATAVDDEGNTYNIVLTFYKPSEPKDTISLDFGPATFLKYYASSVDYYIIGERADYVVVLDIFTDDLAGVYAAEDFDASYTGLYAINAGDTASVGSYFDAKAVIIEDNGAYDIKAELFMSDSILYQVHLTYTKPVALDTIYHTFVNPVEINAFEEGDYYFVTKGDADYIMQMDWYSNVIAGEYAMADLYTQYCGLFAIADGDTTKVSYEDIALKIVEGETDYAITVTYLGSDLHCYILYATSKKAIAEKTVQVNLENASYEDLGASASYYGFTHYVMAAPADSSLIIALAVVPTNFVGNFTQADLYAAYCGVQDNTGYYQISEAAFAVSNGANGSYILQGWLLANNNVKYEFVIKTAEKKQVDMTFSFTPIDGGVTVTPSNNRDEWDFVIITAAQFASVDNDADYVAEYFYSEKGDDYAAPGAYDIIYSENEVTEDGDYVLIVWGADGGVTTPAAVYTFSIGGTTAIDEIAAAVKANKVIRDGQFFIEKGSVRFNANGILVK